MELIFFPKYAKYDVRSKYVIKNLSNFEITVFEVVPVNDLYLDHYTRLLLWIC